MDELFSWYHMDKNFIHLHMNHINLKEFSEVYNLINQHDTFIEIDVKKKLGQFYTPIGTNNKVTEPYSPKGRKKAGKKGIGRFSVERIAEKVSIYSFPDSESPYKVQINWNRYEDINIAALKQRIDILKNHEDSSAAKYIGNQLEFFFLTEKVEEQDKNEMIRILGENSFDYTFFYKTNILNKLEREAITILGKRNITYRRAISYRLP